MSRTVVMSAWCMMIVDVTCDHMSRCCYLRYRLLSPECNVPVAMMTEVRMFCLEDYYLSKVHSISTASTEMISSLR